MATITAPPRPAPLPPVPQRAPHHAGARPRPGRLQSLLIFVTFAAGYFVLGYHVVTRQHVVVFDALDRLTRAYMVWWNQPPKLSAIGFVFPPLTSLVYLPAAIVKPLATSLVALPLTSAIFAAGTMVILNTILLRCLLPLPLRLAVLVLVGLNPLWAFYASNGMSEVIYSFFFTVSVSSYVSWYLWGETRFLIGAGVALAFASLTRYDLAIWAVVLAVLVGVVPAQRRREPGEVEGSVIAYGAPIVYGLVLWTLFNAIIVGKPFNWLKSPTTLAVNSDGIAGSAHASLSAVVSHGWHAILGVAPLSVLVLVLLLIAFAFSRNAMTLSLAGLIAITIVLFGGGAVVHNDISREVLAGTMPVIVASVIGAAWLYRSADGLRLGVAIGMLALLAAALPLAWHQMRTYPFQNGEQAFTRAVQHGDDQEGKPSIGGFTVGIGQERAMADRIDRLVGHRHNAILTDNAQTYAVILLTGRPGVFFDRVDKGDAKWRKVLENPYGRVRYLLISQGQGDLIRQRYPSAVSRQALRPIYSTPRYALVRVPGRGPAKPTPGKSKTP